MKNTAEFTNIAFPIKPLSGGDTGASLKKHRVSYEMKNGSFKCPRATYDALKALDDENVPFELGVRQRIKYLLLRAIDTTPHPTYNTID